MTEIKVDASKVRSPDFVLDPGRLMGVRFHPILIDVQFVRNWPGAAIAPPYFGAVQESRSDTARLNTGLVGV